jgi:hypothetical protein
MDGTRSLSPWEQPIATIRQIMAAPTNLLVT